MSNPRRRFAVYPAGPIQGKTILESLVNLGNGNRAQMRLMEAGFAPVPVFSDFAQYLMAEKPQAIEDVYEASLTLLRKADALLLLPGWEHSRGARLEREVAERHSIPVFTSMDSLCEWADDVIENTPLDPVRAAEDIIGRSDD